ncbi:S-layer homology domain-containing protein [Sporosarcina sp. FSL W7-1349]|uniref:S-layer homology domain-containing protein n=1 Tax=Sporosarcina sp. FSL W7-1349 TaxID=2921561 RepID=UPI0030F76266
MHTKQLFLATVATLLTVPAVVAPVQAAADTAKNYQDFIDISKNHSAYNEIMAMREQGIISGYPDNTFQPGQAISRVHVASLFVRSLDLPPVRPGKEFKDVPKTKAYYYDIQKVYRAGIFDGKPDGTFGINDKLTRAQMAKVLFNAFNLEEHKGYIFDDISESNWAKDYISSLYMSGITTGNNGKFNPQDTVSRAHYAVFLYRALNPDKAPVPDKPLKPKPPITKTEDPAPTGQQPIQKPTLPTERPVFLPDDWPFPPSGLVPRTEDVKKPAGWTPAIYDQHMKKIEETVFTYSPKRGTGVQFGKGGFALYELDDPSFISMNEAQLKSIGSKSTIEEWIAGINYALETGDVYIASDNSYALYAQYSKTDTNGAAIIYIR